MTARYTANPEWTFGVRVYGVAPEPPTAMTVDVWHRVPEVIR